MLHLKLEQLWKSYPEFHAVQDISFESKEKSFIVLAGPSGCGKTTLLEMIAGLTQIDKGQVYINDECMNDVEPDKRGISMVFQNSALFHHMSAFDNIAFGLSYLGLSNLEIDERVKHYARLMRIEDLLDRKSNTLSSGQQQRVSIARALVREPRLVLMDEALNALDARLKSQLRVELAQLYQTLNSTFIYVTHDQVEAMTLAETLIVMKDGRFQQVGAPIEIYSNPNNLFVATFLGKYELNTFQVHIENKHIHLFNKVVPVNVSNEYLDVIVAIRPEHMIEDEQGCVGRIVLVENLGDEIYYHISYDNKVLCMREDASRPYAVHDEIHFSFSDDKILLFDTKTEKRI